MKNQYEFTYTEAYFRKNRHIKYQLMAKLTHFSYLNIWRDLEYEFLNSNFSSYEEAEEFADDISFFLGKEMPVSHILSSADEISNRIIDYTQRAKEIQEEIVANFHILHFTVEDFHFLVTFEPSLYRFLRAWGMHIVKIYETVAQYTLGNISKQECESKIKEFRQNQFREMPKQSLKDATGLLTKLFWMVYRRYLRKRQMAKEMDWD
ncbi:hypothetical protein CAPN001_16410 [Capnocytophaga stomatis]|uniref:hypothetical protein n=1 Tax=Capnocytophaga stomatis TaxID=1848904 RepID=UPI0019523BA3|nr:hypothetical protein [Capnocytophaga stomatis]GIJ97072.1 hypothetical protein CAPN001_16410 [Capnocytophaga stomatis]